MNSRIVGAAIVYAATSEPVQQGVQQGADAVVDAVVPEEVQDDISKAWGDVTGWIDGMFETLFDFFTVKSFCDVKDGFRILKTDILKKIIAESFDPNRELISWEETCLSLGKCTPISVEITMGELFWVEIPQISERWYLGFPPSKTLNGIWAGFYESAGYKVCAPYRITTSTTRSENKKREEVTASELLLALESYLDIIEAIGWIIAAMNDDIELYYGTEQTYQVYSGKNQTNKEIFHIIFKSQFPVRGLKLEN